MSASPLPDARPPDESRGPSILGAVISTTSTALIAVCLRIYVRTCMVRSFGADDYVIIFAMLLSLAGMGITIAEVQYGVGRHSIYLDPEMIRVALKLNFVSQTISQWAIPIAKISIGLSLIRTGPPHVYKRTIQGVIVFLLAFTSARFVLLMIQCIDMAAIWDPRVESKCLSQGTIRGIRYTNSIVNVITDFLVIVLTGIILWNIQTTPREKFSLIPVLLVGIVACAAGVLKPIYIVKLGETGEALRDSASLATWNPVELNMGITASCIPCIRPMFQKLHESAARSMHFSKIDSYGLRPFSTYSSGGRRASRYFQTQTRTEITARCGRNEHSWVDSIYDEEAGVERMPNEIMRTTVVTVDSTAKQRSGSSATPQICPPRAAEDNL